MFRWYKWRRKAKWLITKRKTGKRRGIHSCHLPYTTAITTEGWDKREESKRRCESKFLFTALQGNSFKGQKRKTKALCIFHSILIWSRIQRSLINQRTSKWLNSKQVSPCSFTNSPVYYNKYKTMSWKRAIVLVKNILKTLKNTQNLFFFLFGPRIT